MHEWDDFVCEMDVTADWAGEHPHHHLASDHDRGALRRHAALPGVRGEGHAHLLLPLHHLAHYHWSEQNRQQNKYYRYCILIS